MLSEDEHKSAKAEFERSGHREGMMILVFGIVMLGLAFYLASGDVPLLRGGRLLVGFGLGAAATAAGLIRLANPRAFRDWF